MPEVSISGPCELHLQARRATHFLRVHVPPSGLRQRREIALLSRALTSDEAVVTLVSQCYDTACLHRALAETRTRQRIETPPAAACRHGAVVVMASLHWPTSHVDKRRGDACTVVFMLVSTRIPCGRATW